MQLGDTRRLHGSLPSGTALCCTGAHSIPPAALLTSYSTSRYTEYDMAWNMTWLAGGDPHEHGTWKHDLPKVIRHKVVTNRWAAESLPKSSFGAQDGSARLAALHAQLHAQRLGIYKT